MGMSRNKRRLRLLAPVGSEPHRVVTQAIAQTPALLAQAQEHDDHGQGLPPGSLPVRVSPDGLGVIVTTSAGKDIYLFPSDKGMETLVRLLDIERRRANGTWTVERIIQGEFPSTAGHQVARFDHRGKRRLTLADLGL